MERIAVKGKALENTGLENALTRLETILAEVWDEYPAGEPLDRGASLQSLGIDSLTLTILLDRLESEFRVEWDPDDPPSAFSTLHSLAGSLTGFPSGSPAVPGAAEPVDGAGRK